MCTRPQYWLLKSEPLTYSIDHLASDRVSDWEGVRNYQARNFMRDQMQADDLAIFYHSNSKPSGAVGVCRISRSARPDHSAWNPQSPYFDPRSSAANPRWWMVEVAFESKFRQLVSLAVMRQDPELQGMRLLQKGQRLSILPLTAAEFQRICVLGS